MIELDRREQIAAYNAAIERLEILAASYRYLVSEGEKQKDLPVYINEDKATLQALEMALKLLKWQRNILTL